MADRPRLRDLLRSEASGTPAGRSIVAAGHQPPDRASPALVAAATRIKVGDKASASAVKRRQGWQAECWDSFDAIGEVKYGANYLGNALSRLSLYVGILPDDVDADPVPVTDQPPPDGDEPGPEVLPTSQVAQLRDALRRLGQGPGGHAEILRETSINLSIAGECYLYGREEQGEGGRAREVWDVRSVDEVAASGDDTIRILDAPQLGSSTTSGRTLGDDDYLVRIWQKHPRYSALPDSMLRGVLGAAEELLLMEQAARASARSRMGAGVYWVPSEIDFGPAEGAEADDEDPFTGQLIEGMITPVQDEGDASALAPVVVRAPAEYIEKVRHDQFSRPLDEMVLERQAAALRRIAQGMNLPVEVITCLADVNHWTAWQISEETFKAHVEPLAIMVVNALTEAYLLPMLEAAGVQDADRYVVWYDASRLVARTNVAESADQAHDRFAISDEAYRRARGFDEADGPSPEEILARVARGAARRSVAVAGEMTEGIDPSTGEDDAPEADPTPDTADEAQAPPAVTGSAPALVAAGRVPANLGELLRDIDRDLRNRVEAAADTQMRRALDRAGAALRSKARKQRTAAAAIDGIPNGQVAATLGPGIVNSLGLSEIELVEGTFDPLGDRFLRWCRSAAEATVDLIPGMDPDEQTVTLERFAEHAREAWLWLRDALTVQATALLYDPEPTAPEVGEFDDVTVVGYEIVREAVARAGGITERGSVTAAGDLDQIVASHALGLATGWLSSGSFQDHGVAREAWVWDYGPYRRSAGFPPHAALDGQVFDRFDDPVLANYQGWPPDPHFVPGDHAGCRCDVSPVMVDRGGQVTPEVDVYGPDFDDAALDSGLLVPPADADPAPLRRHPAGGYTAVNDNSEGYYVRQLTTNEGRPGPWRIERQERTPDGTLMATRIGEARTLGDARRVVGAEAAKLTDVGLRDFLLGG